MRSPSLIAVLVVGAVASCAIGSVVGDGDSDAAALARGSLPAFASTARFSIAGGVGSGTLIAPEWVLTAAHVVTDGAGVPLAAGSMTVTVNGESRSVVQIVARPGWNGSNYTAGLDLALVRLSAPVVSAAPASRLTGGAAAGTEITVAGYGAFGFGSTGLTAPPGSLRAVTNTIDGTASSFFPSWSPGLVLMDFDAPGTDAYNRFGGGATGFEGSIATGDSGGGSFVLADGVWRLVGVHSFTFTTAAGAAAPFGYGTGSADVLVSAHAAWIEGVIPAPGTAAALSLYAVLSLRRRRA